MFMKVILIKSYGWLSTKGKPKFAEKQLFRGNWKSRNRKQDWNGNRKWEWEWEFAQKAAWAETTQNSWSSPSQIEPRRTRFRDS